ncbi:TolC family protein [Massilia sp. G4R7]|uniref:TolC family protein n=2 Tax=Massilia TaxID=149698 RepID=A0ABS8QAW1_9BURK|nr:TolC family protein [Massilia phyllostachyos]MCD2518739.1 TolC family protein [Massilia phyllostachyos]
MKNHIIRLALAACALCAHASAAEAPLTLPMAIERALAANPGLRAAGREAAAQEGAVNQAGALPNPELELLREGRERGNRTTTAQLGIPVELGGKRAARVDAARQERALALAALDALRAQVRGDTVAAYYDVVAAGERRRLAQELVTLAERATHAAARRADTGKASPLEATRARVAQSSLRIEAIQAARELAAARIRLAALWGGDAATLAVAAPTAIEAPSVPPLAALEARLATAPDLRRALAGVAHRSALARVEESRRMPDVTLIVGTQRESSLERPGEPRRAVVGVSVPLPLFNRNGGAVLESLRRVDKARDELDAERVRLHAALAQAHGHLVAASEEAALIRDEVVPGAEQAYQAANRGYELGKFGLIDVLDAQRTLVQSRHQYLKAVADGYRALADIERLVGPATQENP